MVGDDIIITNTTPTSTNKIISFNISIRLSLEKYNYTSWCSFLKIHLGSLGIKTHIEGSSTNSNDPEWDKQDDLVKVWILGTLEESLQDQVVTNPGNAKALWDHIKDLFHDNKDARAITLDGSLGLKTHIEGSSTNSNDLEWDKQDDLVKVWILGTLEQSIQDQVVTTSGNAKAMWDHIKDLFHDNKDARAITLDGELRSIKLGSLTINAYCTKIKAMTDLLANLGEKVSDKYLFMYALNGLDTRYKESNLQEATDQANTYDSSRASPTVIMATKPDTKGTHTKA
nr:hybrid signal transduction histidine kinase M [Tanacetum cinerariifolium]